MVWKVGGGIVLSKVDMKCKVKGKHGRICGALVDDLVGIVGRHILVCRAGHSITLNKDGIITEISQPCPTRKPTTKAGKPKKVSPANQPAGNAPPSRPTGNVSPSREDVKARGQLGLGPNREPYRSGGKTWTTTKRHPYQTRRSHRMRA